MAETSVVVMIQRALLVMAWIAWLIGFIVMIVIPMEMGLFHDFARIGRKGASLKTGDHAEKNQPCQEMSH